MTDAEVDEMMLAVFGEAGGQRVLGVLANRYGVVLLPTATDAELRHREGQRSVLADIMEAMQRGRERRSAGTATGGRRHPGG